MTTPELFALVLEQESPRGDYQCFFCGAGCDDRYNTGEFVKDSFTGISGVIAPGSKYICHGCTLCLRESCEVDMVDGTRGRLVTKGAIRAFSWIITGKQAQAASKAHLDYLRQICLEPPQPPFSIVLSDSGKKHLLYRGQVCYSRESVVLTLEQDVIDYRPEQLRERIDLCGKLIAATGKPALSKPPTVRMALNLCERFTEGELLFLQWEEIYEQPLSRLGSWLCPGKEECQRLYPATH